MSILLSSNTQAILLLTAPLIMGKRQSSVRPLTTKEYSQLAAGFKARGFQPSGLLGPEVNDILEECLPPALDYKRISALLQRGFLLSLVLEHWQSRSIWVVSRADPDYPLLYKRRLGRNAPPVLYGCGDAALLNKGGLAMVGSRIISDDVTEYAQRVGRLAARAECTVVSGGARGVDQASVHGALSCGGTAAIILPGKLEDEALARKNREALMDGRLALVSPYDPQVGWSVGYAMGRNKLIYGLSDAALVVESSFNEGGTWPGVVEQLDHFRFVPVYARADGEVSKGLKALIGKGARPWPNPLTPDDFKKALSGTLADPSKDVPDQQPLFPNDLDYTQPSIDAAARTDISYKTDSSPADELLEKVKELIRVIETPLTASDVAAHLGVYKSQASTWLKRLEEEGTYRRLTKRSSRYTRIS